MPSAMKVTLAWRSEKEGSPEMSLKIKLPRKWREGPVSNLKTTFLDAYNSKHDAHALVAADVHLQSPDGVDLADADIVGRVLKNGAEILVVPGAAPTELTAPLSEQVPAAAPAAPARKAVKAVTGGNVATKDALLKAMDPPKRAFDYSKWDRLDLSDDDGEDCHPNIDKASWVRLKGRQRADRRKEEDDKIVKLKDKIEKHKYRAVEIQAKIDGGDDDPQLSVDLQDAKASETRYAAKLDKLLNTRKWVAEDVCDVTEDFSAVSDKPFAEPKVLPERPVDEAEDYDSFVKSHRSELEAYSRLRDDEASEEYLNSHPHLLDQHTEGFLLLLCLDTAMRHKLSGNLPCPPTPDPEVKRAHAKAAAVAAAAGELPPSPTTMGPVTGGTDEKLRERADAEVRGVSRQHLLLHYIMELAKSMKRDPREAVRPFFRKTSKKSSDQVEGFESDLQGFIERITKRADDKISSGEASPLSEKPQEDGEDDEEQWEPAPLGPGGLDPTEPVLDPHPR